MPFDEDDDVDSSSKKIGVKNVSTQKSIFESIPKKPSQEDFDRQVQSAQQKMAGYKQKTAELAIQFKKILEDKTLPENKNIFAVELEREVLSKMIELAIEINNDPNEQEGMGSLSWITFLFKNLLSQRDRINKLEYTIFQLEKKLDPKLLSALISKELQDLDKKK
jgi:hypothetical protein